MAQQTAVEWLYNELEKHEEGVSEYFSRKAIYKQAKAMEKEQIKDAWGHGGADLMLSITHNLKSICVEMQKNTITKPITNKNKAHETSNDERKKDLF